MTLKTTPLFATHDALGASFTDFNGWNMPLRFFSELTEHNAVRNAAGVFDVSHMGEIFLTGPEAVRVLNTVFSSDFSQVSVGMAKYTLALSNAGTIVDDLLVYRLSDQRYLVVPNAGNTQVIADAMTKAAMSWDATVDDASDRLSLLAIQGPRSRRVLAALGPKMAHVVETLKPFRVTEMLVDGSPWIISHTGYTGEEGFEIITPNDQLNHLWNSIFATELNADITACGLAARDSLRLEAGMPLYGNELTDQHTPLEAGLGHLVSFEKPEPFTGRQALEPIRDQTPQYLLVGLTSQQPRAGRSGARILVVDNTVGSITSGIPSPSLSYPVALGYVEAGHAEPGTQVEVEVRGKRLPFVVTTPPFYQQQAQTTT